MNPIESQLNSSREELLDLSLRNTLLNYRPLKSKGVEVVDELPEEIFRLLVSQSRALSFLPIPEKEPDQEIEEAAENEVSAALSQR
jgi:hypothetical protein